jgi:GT2 family glycosyltransferase
MADPRISLVTVVAGPLDVAFDETVASVLAQSMAEWEWVLVDNGTEAGSTPRLQDVAASDRRIRLVRCDDGLSAAAAANAGFAAASGEFVALLEPGDILVAKSIRTIVGAIEQAQAKGETVDLCYSDQSFIGADREPKDDPEWVYYPYIKPDWSPERLRHHMYTAHLSAFRKEVFEEIGGFRDEYDGALLHDLTLRVGERGGTIVHTAAMLCRRRPSEPPSGATEAGIRAIRDHLDRVGIDATVTPGVLPGLFQVNRKPDVTTPVSIIIPTIGTHTYLRGERTTLVTHSIRSILENTDHQNIEIIVVYDTPTPASVLDQLRAMDDEFDARIRLIEFAKKFSWSEKNNVGVIHATGDVFVFLNDDVEAISHGVIEHLLAPLREPTVGMTGPKLLYENGRIQHAGVIYGAGMVAHNYYHQPDDGGAYGELTINREAAALTGACIAVRRDVFEEVGGFTETLPVNYNDVDFCFKVRGLGLRLLWQHDVVLYHFESITRQPGASLHEIDALRARWGNFVLGSERYSNTLRRPISKADLFAVQMTASAMTSASAWLA